MDWVDGNGLKGLKLTKMDQTKLKLTIMLLLKKYTSLILYIYIYIYIIYRKIVLGFFSLASLNWCVLVSFRLQRKWLRYGWIKG